MLGTKVRVFAPLINVSLEHLVPQDHFYRHLERSLDLTFVRELVQACYAAGGRPSVDPMVFFKLQLIMFFEGIRSERQLMAVAADRLSLRWYLGYDLQEPLPDHSSLTRIRDRYGVALFRRFFERIVEQCQQEGLVWGKELYLDSTQVEANADKDQMLPRFYVDAVAEHLATLFPATKPEPPAPGLGPLRLPGELSPEAEAQLAARNAARHDWIAELGGQDRMVTHGSYQRQSDIWVNTTDEDATLMHKKGGGTEVGYHTHYAVDGGTARIILSVLVTPSEVMDNQPMQDLLWHSRFRWHLPLEHVTGDTKYGTVEHIKAIEEAGIRAYVPLTECGTKPGLFGKQRFRYDAEQDQYTCPRGAVLPRTTYSYTEQQIKYRAPAEVCNACPLKERCTTSSRGRTLSRHFDEAYLELVRTYMDTEPYKQALRKRKVWVEPLFGEAKQWHGLERFRLRRLEKVNIEALVTASGQNLKRLLSWRGWGRRWWPGGALGMVIPSDFCLFSTQPV
jgi:transposase